MRTRIAALAGLVLLAAAPALTRAADDKADKPALVVAFKSLDGLIADAKYIATLADKEEEAKQAEKTLQSLVGGPKGLEGVDAKKPIGLYARINEDDPQKSEVVLLLPIADEDAFVKLLKRQDKIQVEKKAADGSYQVNAETIPFPLYLRFANHYAYVTGPTKAGLDKDRLLAPDEGAAGKDHQPGVVRAARRSGPGEVQGRGDQLRRGGGGQGPQEGARRRDAGAEGLPPCRLRAGRKSWSRASSRTAAI